MIPPLYIPTSAIVNDRRLLRILEWAVESIYRSGLLSRTVVNTVAHNRPEEVMLGSSQDSLDFLRLLDGVD